MRYLTKAIHAIHAIATARKYLIIMQVGGLGVWVTIARLSKWIPASSGLAPEMT